METTSLRVATQVSPATEARQKAPDRAQTQDRAIVAQAKEPSKKSEESSESNSEEKEKDRRTLAEA